jgi:hypothetical protein
MYSYTDAALAAVAQTSDEQHRRQRVHAVIELYYRAGVCDPGMPLRVWLIVMGTEVDPPFAEYNESIGACIGAFQPPRSEGDGSTAYPGVRTLPLGTPLDPYWNWWEHVGRQMPWTEH